MKNFTHGRDSLYPVYILRIIILLLWTLCIASVSWAQCPGVRTTHESKTVCQGGSTSLSTVNSAGLTYTWQVSINNGSTWSTVANGSPYNGATTYNLQITGATSTMSGYLYRCTVSNGSCTVTSGNDTLYVYQPAIASPTLAVAACIGNNATLSVSASSPASLTYQWQFYSTLSNIPESTPYSGTTSSALTVSNATTSLSGTTYKVIVTDAYGCFVDVGPYTLTVRNNVAITSQPTDVTVCAGSLARFRVTASNGTSYQWQSDNGTNGVTWSNVGSSSPIYTIPTTTTAMNGYRYRIIVSGPCGPAITSEVKTLTVRRHGTWLGTVDTRWEENGNWCGGVPDMTIDVLVPNGPINMPEISDATTTAFFHSLTIENAARLTISGGAVQNMTGPFDLQGTVAYTALRNQDIFPANHGSIEINGSDNKSLLSHVDISHNLVLGGSAKLVTTNYILTMKTGSNPVQATPFTNAATSWIVTGNGNSGVGNTGLGGFRTEQVDVTDGAVLYPIGPTPASYNPILLTNTGTTDHFTIAVNDQVIPGNIYEAGIDRTWLVSEAIAGGSTVRLAVKWQAGEEQSMFDRSRTEIIRSNGVQVVQRTASAAASGSNPFDRTDGAFSTLTQFSVSSYMGVLPVQLQSFSVQKAGANAASLTWNADASNATDNFGVLRSADGVHFTPIAQVHAVAGKTLYHFTDYQPGSGIIYYRLQMTGRSGDTLYSKVQSLLMSNAIGTRLQPSVTAAACTYMFVTVARSTTISFYLTDIAGRVYLRKSLWLEKGEHRLPLWIDHLSKGIYYIHVNKEVLGLWKQ